MSISARVTSSLRKNIRLASIAFGAVILSLLFTLPCFASPVITWVSTIGVDELQTINISGSGFGTYSSYAGDSYNIYFSVYSPIAWPYTWEAGYPGNVVGLIVNSWTDTDITLGGFMGDYGSDYYLSIGDSYQIGVWNPQSDLGPATFDGIVGTPSPQLTPEPSSVLLMVSGLLALAYVVLRKRFNASLFGHF
jgi:hypothetical protein